MSLTVFETCSFSEDKYQLSISGLNNVCRRYLDKIKKIGWDPYHIKHCQQCQWETARHNMPTMTYADIYEYLVIRISFYTHDQLRSFKSLEAYDLFSCGWVKNIRWLKGDQNLVVVIAEVS